MPTGSTPTFLLLLLLLLLSRLLLRFRPETRCANFDAVARCSSARNENVPRDPPMQCVEPSDLPYCGCWWIRLFDRHARGSRVGAAVEH